MSNLEYAEEEQKFGVLRESGELFLNVADALDFVDYCDKDDWAIIGLEGGTFEDGNFTPDLDLVFDLSNTKSGTWIEYRVTCNDKARLFLSTFIPASEFWFYIIFSNESDFGRLRDEAFVLHLKKSDGA